MENLLARSCFVIASVLAAAGLVGCAASAPGDRAADRAAEARSDGRAALLWSSCLDRERPLGPDCGLLARGLTTGAFLQKFEQERCQQSTPEQCHALYQRMYAAQLRERYYAADVAAVERQCGEVEGACDDPAEHERRLLRSHNERVLARGSLAGLAFERQHVAQRSGVESDAVTAGLDLLHRGPRCSARSSASAAPTLIVCEGR